MLEGFCSDKPSLLTCAQSRARWRQREQNSEGSGGTCHTICTCSIWNQSFNLISGVATGLSIHPSKKEKIRWMFTRQLDVNQLLFQKWVRARGISANSWLQSVFFSSKEIWGRKPLSVYCFKCCIYFIHQIFSPSTAPVREGRDLFFFILQLREKNMAWLCRKPVSGWTLGLQRPGLCSCPHSIPSLRLKHTRRYGISTSSGLFPVANLPLPVWIQDTLWSYSVGLCPKGGVTVQELELGCFMAIFKTHHPQSFQTRLLTSYMISS